MLVLNKPLASLPVNMWEKKQGYNSPVPQFLRKKKNGPYRRWFSLLELSMLRGEQVEGRTIVFWTCFYQWLLDGLCKMVVDWL